MNINVLKIDPYITSDVTDAADGRTAEALMT